MSLKERRKKTRESYSPFGALDRPAPGQRPAAEPGYLGFWKRLFIVALGFYVLGLGLGWFCFR